MKCNYYKFNFLIGVVVTSCLFASCYYDKEEVLYPSSNVDCVTLNATFTSKVKPIIQAKCATSGCHNASSAAAGVILESHSQISSKAARIKQRAVIERTMPIGFSLTDTERNTLQCWIDAGAPNN
jgi:uncharacterized membrane protein